MLHDLHPWQIETVKQFKVSKFNDAATLLLTHALLWTFPSNYSFGALPHQGSLHSQDLTAMP